MYETKENLIESIVELINEHFDMQIVLGENDLPIVESAREKTNSSLTNFLNDFINRVDSSDLKGTLNYYFGNELDFDTPEEFHRY
ncbi:hypothetical protein DNHGIG_19180 [Collibacillus ludicampi]|uniref:Uncharacterized protein n=1 Tax=Collibacillus ludicampi TaxID=2771369 RepID=A0AAV4LFC8_9BACL|nr:hypothetical protein [Collibacillus ludicampi]GIM46369.1 hypothetical protein DNHGIG_19180 [Collibacillus ludicampi]